MPEDNDTTGNGRHRAPKPRRRGWVFAQRLAISLSLVREIGNALEDIIDRVFGG